MQLISLVALWTLAQAPDAALCEKQWAAGPLGTPEEVRNCATFWLIQHGGYGEDLDLTLDPNVSNAAALTIPASRLKAMAKEVKTACDGHCDAFNEQDPLTNRWYRASQLFAGAADARFNLTDMSKVASLEPALAKALAGKALVAQDLEGLSPLSLWRLRNAVYARHGRPFSHPDLQRFFYAKGAVTGTRVVPVKVKGKYSEKRLTAVDKANVAAITALEAPSQAPVP